MRKLDFQMGSDEVFLYILQISQKVAKLMDKNNSQLFGDLQSSGGCKGLPQPFQGHLSTGVYLDMPQ